MKTPGIFLLSALSLGAVERATFDSAGGLTSLIDQGDELALHGALFAYFDGNVRSAIQPHDQRTPITRDGSNLRWNGTLTFPNSSQARYTAAWAEQEGELRLEATVAPEMFLEVQTLDYVFDLPREKFVGGTVNGVTLPAVKPASPVVYSETTDKLSLATSNGGWTVQLTLDKARAVSLTDHWDNQGRTYRVRIALASGLLTKSDSVAAALRVRGVARPNALPAVVTVNPAEPLYSFDGFGGNYCFATNTPVADYIFENLTQAWSRLELKAQLWDRQRQKPGPELVRDFELMKRVQQKGLPWVISLWRLPERFYVDANLKPYSTFGRQIAPERWPEFLDLVGSYLLHLKKDYEAEPDFYSFNEPDLGVNVGFSAEAHREMTKRIGAHLASLGLKTKMLLGDTANPRDTHKYVLATAADPEAMKHVGALSFHSWGSGSPEQYRAWAEVAAWLGLPLIVGEAGTDPGSYRNRSFDSYAYGLREAEQYQQLLRHAKPVTLLYWQFTEDYGLARKRPDGSIEETGRYWLMKHFTNLSPVKSQVVASESNQRDVLVSAFRRGDAVSVHVLNLGPARKVSVTGLGGTGWRVVTSTETEGLKETKLSGAPAELDVPARSMTTLTRGL